MDNKTELTARVLLKGHYNIFLYNHHWTRPNCSASINAASKKQSGIEEQEMEDAESLVCSGAEKVSKPGGTKEDIKKRQGNVRKAYNTLGKIWKK